MRYREKEGERERYREKEGEREREIYRQRGRERLRGRDTKMEVSFFLSPLNCDGTLFELLFLSIFKMS